MVLTIAAGDSAGKIDNGIWGRADLRLSYASRFYRSFPSIVGVYVHIQSRADGNEGDGDGVGNGNGNGNVDGDSDGKHSTRST